MTATVFVRNPDHRYSITLAEPEWEACIGYLSCDPEIEGPPPEERALHIARNGGFIRLHEGDTARDFLGVEAVRNHLHGRFLYESLNGGRPVLHAACLTRDGRRVLLCGPKEAGKSTLSMALTRAGFALEGDENVFPSLSGVIARPRACRVKEGSLNTLPWLQEVMDGVPFFTDYMGRRIFNLSPVRLGAPWRIAPGPADVVLLLRSNHGGLSSLRPVPPLLLTTRLMDETGFPAAGRSISVAAVARLGATSRGFDLSVGQVEDAVKCVEAAITM